MDIKVQAAQAVTQQQAPEQVQETDDKFRFILTSKIDKTEPLLAA